MKAADATKAADLIKQRKSILSTLDQIKEGPITILLSDGKTQLALFASFREELTARIITSYTTSTEAIDKQLADLGVEI